ncbi:MAG TPA: radical SAM family heme chaperone HemW [Blastocatellia bacterium]|nr:radical SAM family heme chaperone HemW [Blastocatellia bacterium]
MAQNPELTTQGTLIPGVYVHIPFCERKCVYCNFNTTDFFEDIAEKYVQAVELEIQNWPRRIHESVAAPEDASAKPVDPLADQSQVFSSSRATSESIDSIYFGGGTPSILRASQLRRLIQACKSSFQIAPDVEITIEVNPGSFSREKLEGWLSAGINRVSVGVQSFIDRELVVLSRTHSAQRAISTLDSFRQAGFTNISLDLIAGLPGQTLEGWKFNLDQAIQLRPEHLSLYLLEVKEGTQLYSQLKRGQTTVTDDDTVAEMYEMICERTATGGYEQYEISNFARRETRSGNKKSYRSKHNMKYWTGAAFYGMGCGAHSSSGNLRWFNILRTETYIERIRRTGSAVAERQVLSNQQRAVEALFMGLRLLEGVSLSEFNKRYGVEALECFGDELLRLMDAELLQICDGHLCLTRKGRLLSNEVFVALV